MKKSDDQTSAVDNFPTFCWHFSCEQKRYGEEVVLQCRVRGLHQDPLLYTQSPSSNIGLLSRTGQKNRTKKVSADATKRHTEYKRNQENQNLGIKDYKGEINFGQMSFAIN